MLWGVHSVRVVLPEVTEQHKSQVFTVSVLVAQRVKYSQRSEGLKAHTSQPLASLTFRGSLSAAMRSASAALRAMVSGP